MPFDDFKFIQSGVLPYRKADNGLEILLITSMRKKHWIIPKGIVEPGLTPAESAEREAFEEAGILGRITGPPIGIYQIRKWGGWCRVEVFAFRVAHLSSDWPESAVRERRWFDARNATSRVYPSCLAQIMTDWIENFAALNNL
jgi:8-oxo-dGTP pyrophosphatase MutT (NUDIX family)